MIFFIRIKDEDFQKYHNFYVIKYFFTKISIYFSKCSQSFKIVLVFMTFPGLEITLLKMKPHTVYPGCDSEGELK